MSHGGMIKSTETDKLIAETRRTRETYLVTSGECDGPVSLRLQYNRRILTGSY